MADENVHFGPFVVTAPSITAIPQQYLHPTGGRALTVIVSGDGIVVKACDLPGPGEIRLKDNNQVATWRCKATGKTAVLAPVTNTVIPGIIGNFVVNAAKSLCLRTITNAALDQTIIQEIAIKKKEKTQRTYSYSVTGGEVLIWALPKPNGNLEALQEIAKFTEELGIRLKARSEEVNKPIPIAHAGTHQTSTRKKIYASDKSILRQA